MKKFKLLSLLLIITLFVTVLPTPADALEDPVVEAPSVVVMDADSGNVLYEKEAGAVIDPYDTAMLMTGLLVTEAVEAGRISLTDEVMASETFAENQATAFSNPPIQTGESMTVDELLHLAVIRWSGDAANILAEQVSDSVANFVTQMNTRAEELGCTDTNFVTTYGAGNDGATSTAMDLARIGREVLKHKDLVAICGTYQYTADVTAFSDPRTVTNYNELISPDGSQYYEYATGLRPGGDSNTGFNIVATATYDQMNVIVVLTGCPDRGRSFTDARTLFEWVFSNYSYRTLLGTADPIDFPDVDMGKPASVGVRPETPVSLLLPNDVSLGEISYEIAYNYEENGGTLHAPVNAGQILGTVTVYMDGVSFGTSRLLAANAVEISRTEYLKAQTAEMFHTPGVRKIITILIVMIAIYLLLIGFYFVQRVRHLRSVRAAKRARAAEHAQLETQWLDIPDQLPQDDYDNGPADGYAGEEDGMPEDGYDDGPEEEYADEALPEEDYEEDDGGDYDDGPEEGGAHLAAEDDGYSEEDEYGEDDGYAGDGEDGDFVKEEPPEDAPEGDYFDSLFQ